MIKDVKGYEGRYQITDDGKVWSILTGRWLKPRENRDGYYSVNLTMADGRTKTELVHRLVALMYCEKPEGTTVVNHIDCNRQNNHYTNLEWTTVQGNTKHGYDYGRVKEAQMKATEAARIANTYIIQVIKNGEVVGVFYGKEQAAEALGINPKTIYNCIRENRKTRQGYSFRLLQGGDSLCHSMT